jgi:hypothetical protein
VSGEGSNKKRVLYALVVGVCAIGAYAFFARKGDRPIHHHDDFDPRAEALKALYDAPPGATPCESSWNAIDAFRKRSDELHNPPPMERFPEQGVFMKLCADVPDAEQPCLVPKYELEHSVECRPILQRLWRPNDAGTPSFATILPRPTHS